jgi:GTP cyclohydrolase I
MLMKANGNLFLTIEEKDIMITKMERKFKEILEIMNFDVDNDQQIQDTPKRVAKMYINELFSGCYNEQPKLTVFNNDQQIQDMVFVGPISLKSTCSHHFVPFLGNIYIAYIPNEKICGISKLARVAKWFMKRPQIQEELTHQIAKFIQNELNPLGCAVYIEAQHLCMIARGVEENNSFMKTCAVYGVFKESQSTKDEFLKMISKQ